MTIYSKGSEMIYTTLIEVVTSRGYNYGEVTMNFHYFIPNPSMLV